MKVIKYILNIIFSFLLVCLVIGMTLLNIFKNNFLYKELVYSKLEEIGFYTQVEEEVNSGFEDFIYQSGLPETTIQNLVSYEKIKSDINGNIESIYNNTEYNISTDEIKEELEKRIDEYISSKKRIINKTDRENIEKFESLIITSYEKNINIIPEGIEIAKKYVPNIVSMYERYANITYVICAIDLIILAVINLKEIVIMLKYLGISILSSGMLLKMVKPILDKSIDIDNVELFTTSLTSFVQNVYRDILFKIDNIGLNFIIVGLVMIIIYSILYATRRNEKEVSKEIKTEKEVSKEIKNEKEVINQVSRRKISKGKRSK